MKKETLTVIIIVIASILSGCNSSRTEKKYYANNNLMSVTTYNKGKKNGEYKKYYENGTLDTTINYSDGLKNGIMIEYYNNGLIKSKCEYKMDTLIGKYTEYYSNGQLKNEVNYSNNILTGQRSKYYSNGKLEYRNDLIDGVIIYSKVFDSAGHIANIYRNIIVKSKDTVKENEKLTVDVDLLGPINSENKIMQTGILFSGCNHNSYTPEFIEFKGSHATYTTCPLPRGKYSFEVMFETLEDTLYLEHFGRKEIIVVSDNESKNFNSYKSYCGLNYGLIHWIPGSSSYKK